MNWLSTSGRNFVRSPLFFAGLIAAALAAGGEGIARADEAADRKVAEAFARLDADQDGGLDADEFLKWNGEPVRLKRDFRLFDFDGNRRLSADEFRAVSGLVPARERGTIPDPVEGILEQAVAALDATYGNWDQNPAQTVPAPNFVLKFHRSLAPNDPIGLSSTMVAEADTDGDSKVTRDEARRFLEIQIGLRASTGDLLRYPSGLVFNYALFLAIDTDRDHRIQEAEFQKSTLLPKKPELFPNADADHDKALTISEFSTLPGIGTVDPLELFRWIDKNFDGGVDRAELDERVQTWLKPLVASVFPGFDLDGNEQLSLDEYRLSMVANAILPWQIPPRDKDRDGLLSFAEFQFDKGQFPLLRRLFFHRLDRDGDDKLSLSEFAFSTPEPHTLFTLNADGSGWQKLYSSRDVPFCGSPAVSPDGKQIAFDGYAGQLGNSRVFVMSIDGTGRRDLCDGLMPNWSPDGKRLACCRNGEAYGVWIINAEGVPQTKIARGWGAQWSPDGKTIAYTDGGAVLAYDVEKEESTPVLKEDESPYQSIYWNMTWSPDSQRLVFKGTRPNQKMEIASIRMVGPERDLKVHYAGENRTENDLAWSPDGRRVVFGMKGPEDKYIVLYEFNPDSTEPPVRMKGQDPEAGNLCDACWTPDGSRLIITSRGK